MLFLEAGAGTLKFHALFLSFPMLFWKSFLAIGCRPCGKAGASVHLEKVRFRLESVSNLAFRPLARTAKKRKNKVNKEEGNMQKTR